MILITPPQVHVEDRDDAVAIWLLQHEDSDTRLRLAQGHTMAAALTDAKLAWLQVWQVLNAIKAITGHPVGHA